MFEAEGAIDRELAQLRQQRRAALDRVAMLKGTGASRRAVKEVLADAAALHALVQRLERLIARGPARFTGRRAAH